MKPKLKLFLVIVVSLLSLSIATEISTTEPFVAQLYVPEITRPRSLLLDLAGDILVSSAESRITAIRETNHGNGTSTVETTTVIDGNGLGLNHGIAFHNGFLYASSAVRVYRWPYKPGQFSLINQNTRQIVVSNIAQDSFGHLTRSLIFDDAGRLYISIGSLTNGIVNVNRSQIRRFNNLDLQFLPIPFNNGEIFADGCRNTVGLAFSSSGTLYGIDNSPGMLDRPDLGSEIWQENPAEELNKFSLPVGTHYGYPFCWSTYNVSNYPLGTQFAWHTFLNDGTHTDEWCQNVNNPLTNAERKKKYVGKLKSNGLYDAYKKKKNEQERSKRKSLKEGLCKLPKATREKMMKIKRENCRERVKRCRMKKAAANQDQVSINGTPGEPGYKTASALYKAAAKTKKTLPSSRTKQIELLAKLVNSFNDDEKQQIVKNDLQVRMKVKRGIRPALITAIQDFYVRDDISRQSPNVKDTRYFINPSTGERELMTKRHLLHKLSDVYNLFIEDYKSNITDQSKPSKPPVKLAKFCALRPAHVKLVGDTPHDMCFCIYHTNFIECCETIHKHLPEFPKYNENNGKDLFNIILCPNDTPNCWLRKCTKCTNTKIKNTMEDMLQRSGKEKNEVKWIQWNKDADANRYYKSEESGTLKDAIAHFVNMCPSFLPHRFVKRLQANTFQNDNKLLQTNSDEAVLQIDFAESFPCEAQDEIQVAHWNQRNNAPPILSLYAHSTPLALLFYDGVGCGSMGGFPCDAIDDVFVAFRGTQNQGLVNGYKVTWYPFNKEVEVPTGEAIDVIYAPDATNSCNTCLRPAGIIFNKDGHLIVTGESTNEIFRVAYDTILPVIHNINH